MKKCFTKMMFTLGIAFVISLSYGQEKKQEKDPNMYGSGLTVKLNESGSKYVRFIMWHQFWLSSNNQTPGMNFSIRRSRVLALTQFTPRFLVLTHFGLNSLGATGISGNPNPGTSNASDLFLHDAWGEFAFVPTKLHVGAGLHYWNGVNRLSSQSTLNFMTLDNAGAGTADARLFPWANITTSDQFARHLGLYAKGTIKKFSYRVAANNARKNAGTLSPTIPSMQVAGDGKSWLYTGYFNVNLLDPESDKLPYMVGSYLGKKKVLSIGGGFHYQPDAIKTGAVDDKGVAQFSSSEAISRVGADVFYDAPVGTKGAAVNILASITSNKYGSKESFNSGGLVPGSGTISYLQAGYLFPSKTDNQLMPYATYSYQDIKSTPNKSYEVGLGVNWFISGHNAKITAEHNIGKKGVVNASTNKMTRIQLHVFI